MQRHRLGTTGIELSAIGLGGAWVGHDPEDAAGVSRAQAVMAAAEESGSAWWLPAWLDRRLPTIDIDGGEHGGEERGPVAEPVAIETGEPVKISV